MTEHYAESLGLQSRMLGASLVTFVGFFVTLVCSPVRLVAQQSARALAFVGVTVIDVADGRRVSNQTVVVIGNRIHAVGLANRVQIPAGARVVKAKGRYIIPGLWDMHAHVIDMFGGGTSWYPRFVAHGVTGVREVAQRLPGGADSFRVWQQAIAAGTRVGPREFGPSVDVSYNEAIRIATPEDARRIIDSLKAAGIAFLKYHPIHSVGTPALFFAVLREGRRVGLPVIGHIPRGVTEAEAADSGLRSVEHVSENTNCYPAVTMYRDSATIAKWCGLAVAAYLRNGTWLTPTLSIYTAPPYDIREALGLVQQMYRLGIRKFLAGTDVQYVDTAALARDPSGIGVFLMDQVVRRNREHLPGVSLLQEVILLVEAGLTPLDALRAATLHPAQFFEATDSLGTVTTGKLADFVLLDADPLTDIRNILTTRAVVANGHYFDRAALDALDPTGTTLVKSIAARPAPLSPKPK